MRLSIILFCLFATTGCIRGGSVPSTTEFGFTPSVDLEADFFTPPSWSHPWVYWWWLEGNISREGILSDLSEMKRVGIAGAIVFDAGSSDYNRQRKTEPGPVYMGDEWRDMFRYACAVADSLDIEISLNITSGWNDGGPWVTPEQTSKKMVWSERVVTGPTTLAETLPMPEGLLAWEGADAGTAPYYKPIGTLAVRLTENSASVKPLENMAIKAVHSIRIPKTAAGLGYDWDIFMKDEPSGATDDCNAYLKDIVDISDRVDAAGNVDWRVPEGEWVVMRFGYTGTGIRVSTNSPGGGGLAIDYMSTEATDLQYANTAGRVIGDIREAGIHSLRYLHDDSWELGAANWTHGFDAFFKNANGYDILPYLPILTGRVIESRDVSNRFLYDFRRTIADLIRDNHYKRFRDLAHADGYGIHPESGGPHPAPIDALRNEGLNDIPMGEFWIRATTHRVRPEDRLFVKQPASAAHIYGKRFVQAEGPTSIGPHWEEDFAYMKPTMDRAYCEGLNRWVVHTFTHSPKDAGVPGNEYFAGTHFNPNVTWWGQASAFIEWNSRVSMMLAQGLFVGDVCYYYGDNVPNQVPLKHVGEGLGEGYDYDVCNTEVIIERMSARNGRIWLPDGMSYRLLVLPERTGMTLGVITKLEQLVRDGATILGPKPTTSVGLRNDGDAVESVRRIADKMWGEGEGTSEGVAVKRPYGKGFVCTGMTEREILTAQGAGPDFEYRGNRPDALVDYIHRSAEDAEIYYVVNRNDRPEYMHLSFRVADKVPELWDPIHGTAVDQPLYATDKGVTSMPLFLEPFGSMFVVFRRHSEPHYTRVELDGKCLFPELPDAAFESYPWVVNRDGLSFMHPGRWTLTTPRGETQSHTVESAAAIDLSAGWNVSFDPAWGGPEAIMFDSLTLWNDLPDPGVKYYSGTAVYKKTFTLAPGTIDGKHLWLDLGEMYNLAEVSVNGTGAGVWWQPPFRGDVTKALRDGENHLEIRVVNLWPNRIIGDELLPEDQRFTKTNVGKFHKDYPLRNSGLAGPVQIKMYDNKIISR